jgi:hypothetical protein
MNDAFRAANANFVALLAEGLHPNDAGYRVMAGTWYDAIESFLPLNRPLEFEGRARAPRNRVIRVIRERARPACRCRCRCRDALR